MRENKTKATKQDVDTFLDALPDEHRRADAKAVGALMEEVTGEQPYVYGSSIVGFGNYHYRYDSGREGDAPLTAFSPRAKDLDCDGGHTMRSWPGSVRTRSASLACTSNGCRTWTRTCCASSCGSGRYDPRALSGLGGDEAHAGYAGFCFLKFRHVDLHYVEAVLAEARRSPRITRGEDQVVADAQAVRGVGLDLVDCEGLHTGKLGRVDGSRAVEQHRGACLVRPCEGRSGLEVQAIAMVGLHDIEADAAADGLQ